MIDNSLSFFLPDVVPNMMEVKTSSPKKGMAVTALPKALRRSRGSGSSGKASLPRNEDEIRQAMETLENFHLNLQQHRPSSKRQVFLIDSSDSSTIPSPVSSMGTPNLEKEIRKNGILLKKLDRLLHQKAESRPRPDVNRYGVDESGYHVTAPPDHTFERILPFAPSDIEIHRAASDTRLLNAQPSTSSVTKKQSTVLHGSEPLVYDQYQQYAKNTRFKDTKLSSTSSQKTTQPQRTIFDRSIQVNFEKSLGGNPPSSEIQKNMNELSRQERYTNERDDKWKPNKNFTDFEHILSNRMIGKERGIDETTHLNHSLQDFSNAPTNFVSPIEDNQKLCGAIKKASSFPNVRRLPAALKIKRPIPPIKDVFAPTMDVDSIPKKKKMPLSTRRTLASSGVRFRMAPPRPMRRQPNHHDRESSSSREKSSKRKAALPFLTTGAPNQLSYSLPANQQLVLRLLKEHLPNLSKARELILDLDVNIHTDLIKSFTKLCEDEMSALDTIYVSTLHKCEQLDEDDDKRYELDRRMDKYQKEYDTLKAILTKLESVNGPARPLPSETENGGIVHQLKMIQLALGATLML